MTKEMELPGLESTHRPATEAAHAGEIASRDLGTSVAQPIYQTTVHAFKSLQELDRVQTNPEEGWFYYRNASPNRTAFETTLARLEGAEAAVAAGSGMGAIFIALSAVLKSGDHVIADEKIYGGTFALLTQQLPKFGIETTFVNTADELAVRAAVRPTTRVLYFETLTNPTLQVSDLPALADLARELNLYSFVDATFSTPVVCRPLLWGVDLVMHASTKYIGGHSDAFGGIVAGRADLVKAADLAGRFMGVTQGAFDAWLNVRSLKTLPLRMTAHSQNAQKVAEWLEKQPGVQNVLYPGLPSHPQHELAKKLMPDGLYGGMLAFELGAGPKALDTFIGALKVVQLVPSLADVTTTLSHPALTSHRAMSPAQRANIGARDELLRLSVGIEDIADILDDFEQAFRRL
jgi:cystathionine gamma-synthase